MKKGIRNSIIFTLSAAMLAVPATANATEVTRNEPSSQLSSVTRSYDGATTELRNKAVFTEEELSQLTPSEITELDSQLTIHQQSSVPRRISPSTLGKIILRIWKSLPAGIRHKIEQYTTLSGFIKAIDHFTGTEDHIIYSACRYVGMNDTWAKIVTKTITLFL